MDAKQQAKKDEEKKILEEVRTLRVICVTTIRFHIHHVILSLSLKFKTKIKDCKLVDTRDEYIVKWLQGTHYYLLHY